MKNILIFSLLLCWFGGQAQTKIPDIEFRSFYEWFMNLSQTDDHYQNGSFIRAFSDSTMIHEGPCLQSEVLDVVGYGEVFENMAYEEFFMPTETINGYQDFWYHIQYESNGHTKNGYVWGGHIAKGWKTLDITGDDHEELVMVGISKRSFDGPGHFFADVRIIQNDLLFAQQTIPGLCLFQLCGADVLLHIEKDRHYRHLTVIEASTLAIGCDHGIERTFLVWNGQSLERAFQGEITTKKVYYNETFHLNNTENVHPKKCRFAGWDDDYMPIWECEQLQKEVKPKIAEAQLSPDRA